jgi:hypothetical protein
MAVCTITSSYRCLTTNNPFAAATNWHINQREEQNRKTKRSKTCSTVHYCNWEKLWSAISCRFEKQTSFKFEKDTRQLAMWSHHILAACARFLRKGKTSGHGERVHSSSRPLVVSRAFLGRHDPITGNWIIIWPLYIIKLYTCFMYKS